jgi:hypothetical protein
MKALISPNEIIYNYDAPPIAVGVRIAEVVTAVFEVCTPLFWVDCDETIIPNQFYYNEGMFYPAPVKPVPPKPPEATEATGPVVI